VLRRDDDECWERGRFDMFEGRGWAGARAVVVGWLLLLLWWSC
jgi:hypothetical protein